MESAKPTLGYWHIRAVTRGNINRYILAYAKVDYTDHRYSFENPVEWSNDKNGGLDMDFPNLPYWIDGDFKLSESKAITWYLCDKYCPDLLGSNVTENALVDMLYQRHYDLIHNFVSLAVTSEDREAVIQKAMESAKICQRDLGGK